MGRQKVRDRLLSIPMNPCRKTAKVNSESDFQLSDLYQVDATRTAGNTRGGNEIHQDVSREAGKNAPHFKILLLCLKVNVLTNVEEFPGIQ